MTMKDPIRLRAEAVATSHFRCTDGSPWEPYENRDPEWVDEQIEALADAIELSMRWAVSRA